MNRTHKPDYWTSECTTSTDYCDEKPEPATLVASRAPEPATLVASRAPEPATLVASRAVAENPDERIERYISIPRKFDRNSRIFHKNYEGYKSQLENTLSTFQGDIHSFTELIERCRNYVETPTETISQKMKSRSSIPIQPVKTNERRSSIKQSRRETVPKVLLSETIPKVLLSETVPKVLLSETELRETELCDSCKYLEYYIPLTEKTYWNIAFIIESIDFMVSNDFQTAYEILEKVLTTFDEIEEEYQQSSIMKHSSYNEQIHRFLVRRLILNKNIAKNFMKYVQERLD
jgi:hypothetical protein